MYIKIKTSVWNLVCCFQAFHITNFKIDEIIFVRLYKLNIRDYTVTCADLRKYA